MIAVTIESTKRIKNGTFAENKRLLNRTFTMIKPDAVENGHTGAILEKINSAGFRIVGLNPVNCKWCRGVLCGS